MCELKGLDHSTLSPELAVLAMQPWKIVKVRPLSGYRLEVAFFDGTEGEISLAEKIMSSSSFAALRDNALFNQAFIECCGISWPNDLSLEPQHVYNAVTQNKAL
jgi:hypothetical protein